MRERWQLSDGQILTTTHLDGTGGTFDVGGVRSEHHFDVEENAAVDMMQQGFMNVIIISAVGMTNLTEGLRIALRTGDAAALETTPEEIGSITIRPARIVAGAKFSVPFKGDVLQTFIGAWYNAVKTAMGAGTIVLDAWLSDTPISQLGLQKKPS